VQWDLSSIPAGSVIQSVSLSFHITDATSNSYPIYELKRNWVENWVENQTTWRAFSLGASWQTAGAQGTSDRGSTILGTVTTTSTGLRNFSLNAAGVVVVQSWIDDPGSNNGFIIQNYNNTNRVAFASRETAAISSRPAITLSYLLGPASATANIVNVIGKAPIAAADLPADATTNLSVKTFPSLPEARPPQHANVWDEQGRWSPPAPASHSANREHRRNPVCASRALESKVWEEVLEEFWTVG
jgi:hypothetical protein